MARKEKTAIKHVTCGGVVLQYQSWGRPIYLCSRCKDKSRDIDYFTIRLMLAQLGGQERDNNEKI